jgi:asparagine synthetase B (glutamine-hydrolysing)
MCGIAGIIGNYKELHLDAMLASQHHRGPDATGKYLDAGFAALGHNRLAIIDLTAQSNQPFIDNSGRYVIVFNGEIYNYIEIKADLQNQYDFKTESDTEVLLAAFIVYGKECLEKCNGMFSFVIWDHQEKRMFAARDRFGVKPFYYSVFQNSFYFSSEIKALHAAGIPKVPNEKVWASYFAYGSYGSPDETFWEGIRQLPGGHFLEVAVCKSESVKDQSCLIALRQAQCDKDPSCSIALRQAQCDKVQTECETESVKDQSCLIALRQAQCDKDPSCSIALRQAQCDKVQTECETESVEDQSCLLALRSPDELRTGLAQCDIVQTLGCQTESVEVFCAKINLTIEKWYYFEDEVAKQPKNLSFEQAKQQYVALLKDSIHLRFRADVPVGFNISGGLDSSVLLALVNLQENSDDKLNCTTRLRQAQTDIIVKQPSAINAYTFYTNNPEYDELPWVEAMIAKTHNPLTRVLLEAEEVPDFAKKMAAQQDEPYGGIPTLAYAKIFEQARKDKVLVLLDGQGMDEQWAGYDYYTQQNEATIQGVQASPYKTNMLSEDFLAKAIQPSYSKPFEDDVLNKQYRDLFYTKIPRALRFNDRVSMLYSTELREPFLDYRLVELAFSLPLDFKIRKGVSKYMLREIASEYLADDLVFAPKRALQTPQREWLAEDLAAWVRQCFAEIKESPLSGWFNEAELQKELKSYMDGNSQSSFHIWQCVGLWEMFKNDK